jgi:MFS transporter, putative metabolite:H+ symporter
MALTSSNMTLGEQASTVASADPEPKTIGEYLDSLPIGSRHMRIFIAAGAGFAFDAFELGILAFAGPSISKEWGLANSDIGLLFSLTAIGMAIGSYSFGTASDYFGRIRAFQLSVLIFAVGSGASFFANGFISLGCLRVFTGIGIGGLFPVDYAIISEFAPARKRGLTLGLLATFFPIGSMATAQIAGLIIPAYGWRAMFLVGVIPAIAVLFVRMFIPESPRFLMERGRIGEARASLKWLNGGRSLPESIETMPARPYSKVAEAKVPIGDLFGKQYRLRTAFSWIIWFCWSFVFFGLLPWLPTLLVKFRSYPAADIFFYMTMFSLSGLVFRLLVAAIIDWVGRRPVLIAAACGATISLVMFSQQTNPTGLLVWACVTAMCLEGFNAGLTVATAELFPTRIRSTGIGWAQGIARIGAIGGPLAVAAIVVTGVQNVFLMFAGAYLVITLVTITMFRSETKQLSLEAASKDEALVRMGV